MADGHRFENLLGESSDPVGAETGGSGTGGHAPQQFGWETTYWMPPPRICLIVSCLCALKRLHRQRPNWPFRTFSAWLNRT